MCSSENSFDRVLVSSCKSMPLTIRPNSARAKDSAVAEAVAEAVADVDAAVEEDGKLRIVGCKERIDDVVDVVDVVDDAVDGRGGGGGTWNATDLRVDMDIIGAPWNDDERRFRL